MAKKDNFNNNDPISKAVDLLLENTEVECQPFLGLFFGRHLFMIFNGS
ncbi:hypothetical protein SHM_23640 [Spiroplasma ixodetis]|uniref:Uncharacterized protein n=2 Tax=Spiroplasma ixodetis TaxID=2141 RepID=A0ABM8BYD0_9MOLU|nr:hypothetical protein SHM_23640 [Spiroplasma ixodetis]